MKKRQKRYWPATGPLCILVLASLLFSFGCSGKKGPPPDVSWNDLINELTSHENMARLDRGTGNMASSVDPTGNNKDHNHFPRKGPDGWAVIADLKGPGYVSRMWMTGFAADGVSKLRFYFDNARRPQLEISLADFFGGKEPFLPPVAIREQACWHSYMPIPYSERLVIMVEEKDTVTGNDILLYYQINHVTLPEGQTVESLPKKTTAEQLSSIKAACKAWNENRPPSGPGDELTEDKVLEPGTNVLFSSIAGPASISRLELTPDFTGIKSARQRETVLRKIILQLTWDGKESPGISVPLGDFFGSVWRKTRFQSMFIGMTGETFYCNLPMPFKESASISLVNNSGMKIPLKAAVKSRKLQTWDGTRGYLHAEWRKTGQKDFGRPHQMMKASGKGKYVGCILVMSNQHYKQGWWPLESNEYMFRDNEFKPSWGGTGMEDYFNGGWYYRNPRIRPLHGLTYMAPFQVIQYRFNLNDPFTFTSSGEVMLERGPSNRSAAILESVSYFYLAEPAEAKSSPFTPQLLKQPPDLLEQHTIVKQLTNLERIGDYRGAHNRIDSFIEQYPDYQGKELLQLRQIAYREYLDGFEKTKTDYEQFIKSCTNKMAVTEAEKILEFHQSPDSSILHLYCNAKSLVYLDGKPIVKLDNPETMFALPLKLKPGKHVICIEAVPHRPMPWVQLCLRTHDGIFTTFPEWRFTTSSVPGMHSPDFDDSNWMEAEAYGKGPPESPWIRQTANPYVNMQSQAPAIQTPAWGHKYKAVVYRQVFDIPLKKEAK